MTEDTPLRPLSQNGYGDGGDDDDGDDAAETMRIPIENECCIYNHRELHRCPAQQMLNTIGIPSKQIMLNNCNASTP
jgi:hypothetical protein